MKRRLEEMESENHEKFPLVMKIVKSYCEAKKKMIMRSRNNKRRRGGRMIVGRDSNGNPIKIAKKYSEAKKEQKLRMEEAKKKKEEEGGESESDSEDDHHEPWEFRWSDENLASHIWRCMCRKNGVKVHEYVPRTDYHNMSGAEVRLDLLWRKVYQAEAEADAATTNSTTTS